VATGTVFMPVEAIDTTLGGLGLPASVDVVKFLLTLILALPLGYISRFVPVGNARHVYNLFLGIAFAQGCYGPGWLHMSFSAAVSYFFLLFAPRNQVHLIVFGWMMFYIGATHIYRMYSDWLGWEMDFSGPQMMATIKITSCAFNYHDGKEGRTAEKHAANLKAIKDEMAQLSTSIAADTKEGKDIKASKKKLSALRTEKSQQELALDALPSPLEFFGWVQNFSTYQAGPALEVQEYLLVNNGGKDGAFKLPAGQGLACLRQFVQGVVCLGCHVALDGVFPLGNAADGLSNKSGVLSDSFLDLALPARMGYAIIAVFGIQMRYFMAWKLGEAAATSFGYGSNGGKWNGCQNIDLKEWLLAENMSAGSKAWNQKTQEWLQKYTYFRFPGGRGAKLLATYAVSAYWHGFYPGYYITFFTLGVLSMCQDNLKAHVNPYVPEGVPMKVYSLVSQISMNWIKTFATMPFLLSTATNAWAAYSRLYFLGALFTLIGLFVVPMIPKKRAKKAEKPAAATGEKAPLLKKAE